MKALYVLHRVEIFAERKHMIDNLSSFEQGEEVCKKKSVAGFHLRGLTGGQAHDMNCFGILDRKRRFEVDHSGVTVAFDGELNFLYKFSFQKNNNVGKDRKQ